MWTQPHYTYHFTRTPAADNWEARIEEGLSALETWVPGAMVYGFTRILSHSGREKLRKIRLHKMEPAERDTTESYEVHAPLHAAWLVEGELIRAGITYDTDPSYVNGVSFWCNDRRASLEERGRKILDELIDSGIVRSHVRDIVTPYQAVAVAWAQHRPYVFNVWSCGSGKTLGAILSAHTRTGPTLALCPAKARHVWWSQVKEYTTIEPFRVRPRGERKEGEETLEAYLRRMGSDAFVIVGAEAIHEYLDEIYMTQPSVFIFDEMHLHGSSKRWTAIHREDGGIDFQKRTTKANKETRAVAMMEIARMNSIKLRIALTATPLDDGRPRRMWSQLDLLAPGGFSHSYSKFALRYCDATPGQYGGLDDRGSSNLEELRARCSFFTHEVPYGESHASLPSTRVQVVYLDQTDLNGAGRFSDDQTFNQAIRSISREARTNSFAREQLLEARLAQACSRKRGFVIDEVKQGVRGGGKVVVFTARRNEAEVWAHKIRKALTEGDEKLSNITVWTAHGGVSETERDRITDAYRDHSGPCVLVATGQSIGTGVDGLQTTDLAVFAMLPWKPGDFVQWKGRFDRLGGSPTLLKVVVATGTYDERVVEILTEKFGAIEQFLQADELRGLDTKLLGLEDGEAVIDSIINQLETS